MRAPLIWLLGLLAFSALLDWYVYVQIIRRCHNVGRWKKIFLGAVVFCFLMLLGAIILPARKGDDVMLRAKMWMLYGYVTVFFPKIIAVLFDLLASIPRLFHKKRIKALTITGMVLAVVIFCAFWWGALINRFRIQQNDVDIPVRDLPSSFDDYRITQFSDFHVGTYGSDTTFVSRFVNAVNATEPDVIVFTGDIVNRRTSEIEPFIKTLSRLNAPDGVYAILGNHDYGDYVNWKSPEDKQANMETLYNAYERMGIKLLRNETAWIHRGPDSLALIGVENIGDPPFPVYGSLSQAYSDISDSNAKVLLTHNPAHWVDSISSRRDINIPLTLSGHTHAMQFSIGGISPAALRYKTWGGLYTDSIGHNLYVNIGAGEVGFPARIGATPEITVLRLQRR